MPLICPRIQQVTSKELHSKYSAPSCITTSRSSEDPGRLTRFWLLSSVARTAGDHLSWAVLGGDSTWWQPLSPL